METASGRHNTAGLIPGAESYKLPYYDGTVGSKCYGSFARTSIGQLVRFVFESG